MKKIFFVAASMIFLALGSSAQQTKVKKEPDKLKTKTESREGKEAKVKVEDDKIIVKREDVGKDLVYPYTPEYSSQFVPGSPAHAKLVLDLWKDWDNNTVNRQAAFLADTMVMVLFDGKEYRGKDSVLAALRNYRSPFTTVSSTVESWVPLKSIDRNEDWVFIWGREVATDKDGKALFTRYHEMVRINKDGKIDFLRQYTAPHSGQ